MTKQAPNPDELISIQAYYEMNPEMDDRPEAVLNEIKQLKKSNVAVSKVWEELVELSLAQKAAKAEREEAIQARKNS